MDVVGAAEEAGEDVLGRATIAHHQVFAPVMVQVVEQSAPAHQADGAPDLRVTSFHAGLRGDFCVGQVAVGQAELVLAGIARVVVEEAVTVDVGDGNAHAGLKIIETGGGADVGEDPAAIAVAAVVAKHPVRYAVGAAEVVHDEQVDVVVAVVVGEGGGQGAASLVGDAAEIDAGGGGHIREGAVAVRMPKLVDEAGDRKAGHMVADEEVQVAVFVVVSPGGRAGVVGAVVGQARFLRGVLEGELTGFHQQIAVQAVARQVSDVDVLVAVIVVVGGPGAMAGTVAIACAGGIGDGRETAVPIIQVEQVASRALDRVDVVIPVRVEVDPGRAATDGDVRVGHVVVKKAGTRCDVGQSLAVSSSCRQQQDCDG